VAEEGKKAQYLVSTEKSVEETSEKKKCK